MNSGNAMASVNADIRPATSIKANGQMTNGMVRVNFTCSMEMST